MARTSATRPPGPAVFLLLAGIFTTAGGIAAIIAVHLIAILQSGGMALAAAVGVGTLLGPAQVAGRLVEAFLGGRYHPIWTLAASAALIAAGMVLLWSGSAIALKTLPQKGAAANIKTAKACLRSNEVILRLKPPNRRTE